MYTKLSEREEWLAKQIVDIAIAVHKELGPGLLESIYVKCFCIELRNRNIQFELQKKVLINYKEHELDDALFIDMLVENCVVIEFKAQDYYHPVWEAQVLSYLKLSKKRIGFVLNFHVPVMKDGIKRYII